MERLSLRLRIGLFFAALGAGALGALALGLWVGFRHDPQGGAQGYVTAGLVAGFGIAGIVAGIWQLFDEHMARPIQRIATDMRLRADAGLGAVEAGPARYLGDLGPAASALSRRLDAGTMGAVEGLAGEARHLRAERERLTALLSEIPLAMILLDEAERILLYDGQAAAALETVRPPALGQPLSQWFDMGEPRALLAQLAPGESAAMSLATVDGHHVYAGELRRMVSGGGCLLTLDVAQAARAERPLAYDFSLPAPGNLGAGHMGAESASLLDRKLSELVFVVFDTETTGLLPARDEVVQIGAIRALGLKLVPGESFATYVNPGRAIPARSSAIHGITDRMVAGAPPMAEAGRRFLDFAEGAVLVAHNAPFDMAFLSRHARATGAVLDHPVLDTVLLGAELLGTDRPLTLEALAARLEVPFPEEIRHSALGDAQATARVFLRMCQLFEARGVTTLRALILAQKRHPRLLPDMNPELE